MSTTATSSTATNDKVKALPPGNPDTILNFNNASALLNELDDETNAKNYVHLRVVQRNGKKRVTIIEGLEDDLDLKRIAQALQKTLKCGGHVVDDAEHGLVIQLTGDQRLQVRDFLLEEGIVPSKNHIKVHGY